MGPSRSRPSFGGTASGRQPGRPGRTHPEGRTMRLSIRGDRIALTLSVAAAFVAICVVPARAQDPDLKPAAGSAALTAGFATDPLVKKVVAGGKVKTNLGGVEAFVAGAPDFVLDWTA